MEDLHHMKFADYEVSQDLIDSLRFATPVGNVKANRTIENHSGVTMKHKGFLLYSDCVYIAVEHNLKIANS